MKTASAASAERPPPMLRTATQPRHVATPRDDLRRFARLLEAEVGRPGRAPRGAPATGATGPRGGPHRDAHGAGEVVARESRRAGDRAKAECDALAPFAPPPPVLAPPPTVSASAGVAGSAAAHAQAAALAERLVSHMQVGRVGRRGHEVRIRLSGTGDGIDVRLRMVDDQLTAVLSAPPERRAEADRIAALFEGELSSRGVALAEVTVETR